MTATCASPASATPGASSGAETGRRCASRRAFTIHFRRPPGARLLGVSVKLNGRPIPSGRRGAAIVLRNLPRGTFRVTVALRVRQHRRTRTVTHIRRYHTCEVNSAHR